MMKGHPDILRITEFPDTNQDAVTAIVMRFLHLEVFSKVKLVKGGLNYPQRANMNRYYLIRCQITSIFYSK